MERGEEKIEYSRMKKKKKKEKGVHVKQYRIGRRLSCEIKKRHRNAKKYKTTPTGPFKMVQGGIEQKKKRTRLKT